MASRTEDRLALHELVALHGHLFDMGELDRLDELFTEDVVYDDVMQRTAQGWRLARRKVRPRRRPLEP
jgi:ketosteroid isomerase-like protein